MKAERARPAAVLGTIQRAAGAELHRPPGIDQALLDGALAPGAMRVALAPVVVPGIGVGVEVDQSNRAVLLRDGAKFSERDRMIPTECQGHDAGLEDGAQT